MATVSPVRIFQRCLPLKYRCRNTAVLHDIRHCSRDKLVSSSPLLYTSQQNGRHERGLVATRFVKRGTACLQYIHVGVLVYSTKLCQIRPILWISSAKVIFLVARYWYEHELSVLLTLLRLLWVKHLNSHRGGRLVGPMRIVSNHQGMPR